MGKRRKVRENEDSEKEWKKQTTTKGRERA